MMKRALVVFILSFLFLLFLEVPGTLLFEPDEPRYANIPQEMLASQNFVTPTLNGSIYIEKPPLLYWSNALFMAVFGQSAYTARLTVRMAGLLIVVMMLLLLPKTRDDTLGLWSALIYISSFLPFALHRINIIDALLTASLTLVFLSIYRLIENPTHLILRLLLGFGLATAVLSKGLVGLVFPVLVFGLWILIHRRWDLLKPFVFSPAWMLFLAMVTPWFYLVQKENPGFLEFFFVREHFQRFTTTVHERYQPFWFFGLTFLWGFFPWTPLFFLRLYSEFRNWISNPSVRFVFLWSVVPVVFFSFSHSKLIPYILPALPGFSVLLAWTIRSTPPKWIKSALSTWACILFVVVSLLPHFSRQYTSEPLIRQALDEKADQVIAFECYPRAAPWVLKRPVPIVGAQYREELVSIGPLNSDYFWSVERFQKDWSSGRKVFALVSKKKTDSFLQQMVAYSVHERASRFHNRRFRLYSNTPD